MTYSKPRTTIFRLLETEPYLVNSINVAPQDRERLIWTNLVINIYEDSNSLKLQDILIQNLGRQTEFDSTRTITTNSSSTKSHGVYLFIIVSPLLKYKLHFSKQWAATCDNGWGEM